MSDNTVEEIFDGLGSVLDQWAIGRDALPAAPHAWMQALGSESTQAQLNLLALTGQFLSTSVTVEPNLSINKTLSTIADLPQLALPVIPNDLRVLVTRALHKDEKIGPLLEYVLALLEKRGWTINPCNWLPSTSTHFSIPMIYWPWVNWVTNIKSNKNLTLDFTAPLSDQNWDRFLPEQRQRMLELMRERDPAMARSILESKLAKMRSPEFLQLFKAIRFHLSSEDLPFLQNAAAKSRSDQVKSFAKLMIRSLGSQDNDQDYRKEMDELKGFFQKSQEKVRQSEFIHKNTENSVMGPNVLKLKPLKTSAQVYRMAQLLEGLTWSEVASELGLSKLECLWAWPWGEKKNIDEQVAAMIERTADNDTVLALCDILLRLKADFSETAAQIAHRLPQPLRFKLAQHMMVQECRYQDICLVGGADFEFDVAMTSKSALGLIEQYGKAIKPGNDEEPRDGYNKYILESSMQSLCSRASRDLALVMLEKSKEFEIQNTVPSLFALLELNAALPNSGVKA